jgi:DNA-directed RNA polymerase specialized sigma24 family protein
MKQHRAIEGLAEHLSRAHRNPKEGLEVDRAGETLAFLAARVVTGDQTAALRLLVALAPELRRVARRLVRAGVEAEEAEAETLAGAWELIAGRDRWPVCWWSSVAFAEALWGAVRRSARLRRRGPLELVSLPDDFDGVAPEPDPLERFPAVLAAAVAAGVLTPRQVVVIAETRMAGSPLREVAVRLGRPYGATKKERQRAEAALRAFALSYSEGSR